MVLDFKRSFIVLVSLVSILLSVNAFGADQIVSLSPSTSTQRLGGNFTIDINYNVTDNNNNLSGIDVSVYFDSGKLSYDGYSHFFTATNEFVILKPDNVITDSNDLDNDQSTDSYVGLKWFASGSWPNEDLPLLLSTLRFTVLADADVGKTPLNVIVNNGASGYGYKVNDASVSIVAHGDPTQFVIQEPSDVTVDNNATITVQLQDKDGNVVTSNNTAQVTVQADAGTLSTQPVTVTNGVATASLSNHTPGTVNLSLDDTASTGFDVTSTADVLFTPGAAAQTDVSASATTIASDTKGSTELTAKIKDQYGNLRTSDNSTAVTFTLSNATYVQFTDKDGNPVDNDTSNATETVNATNGVASIYLTSRSGEVGDKQSVQVNATTAPVTSVSGSPLTVSVVDFGLDVMKTALKTGESTTVKVYGARKGDTLTQQNSLDAGSLTAFVYNSTGFYQATYTAGSTIGSDTLKVKSTNLDTVTNTVTLTVYKPVAKESGFTQDSFSLAAGTNATFEISGGDAANQTWYVTGPGGGNATNLLTGEGSTRTFTAPKSGDYAGAYEVKVTDDTLGTTYTTTVYVPLGAVTVSKDYVLTNSTVNCKVAGASDGITWTVVDADGDTLNGFSGYDNTNASSVIINTPDDLNATLPFKVCTVKDGYDETKSCSGRKQVVLPVARVVASAQPTTIASKGMGKAELKAEVQDKNGDLRTFDNSTSVTFALSSDEYVYFASENGTALDTDNNATTETVNATNGVASIYVRSQNGTVDGEKAVNATVTGSDPNATRSYKDGGQAIGLTVVNFSMDAGDAVLETHQSTTVSVYGALQDDKPNVTDGASIGTLRDFAYNATSGAWQATYTATSNGTETLRVHSDALNATSNTLTIQVYQRFALQKGEQNTFTVSGGDAANQTWSVAGPDGDATSALSINGTRATFHAPQTGNYAGKYTIRVQDSKLGKDLTSEVIVPLGKVTRTRANVLETNPNGINCTVAGASSGITWSVVDGQGNVLTGAGTVSGTSNSTTFIPADVDTVRTCYVQAVKDNLQQTLRRSLAIHVIPTDTYTVTLENEANGTAVTGGVTVYVGNQSNSSISDAGQVTFQLADTGGTYRYEVEDLPASPHYINKDTSTAAKNVTITLQPVGASLNGTVGGKVSGDVASLANATVTAYQPDNFEHQYEATTDVNGTFAIHIPGTYASGWTIAAKADGYQAKSQEGVYTTGNGTNFVLSPKTQITSANATAVNGTVILQLTADPAITSISDVSLDVKQGAGGFENATVKAGGVYEAAYNATDDFRVRIKVDPDDAYLPATGVVSYSSNAAATGYGLANSSGGGAELSQNNQNSTAFVPVGGVKKSATLTIRQVTKSMNATQTKGSPTYVYDVTMLDDNGTELNANDINYVEITMPIDLGEVAPGDLENGNAVIYYASSAAALEAGNGHAVPASHIVNTDYIGDGNIGSVTFWVDHLTVFSVGSAGSSSVSSSSGSSGGCVISPQAGFGPEWMLILLLPVVVRLWLRRQG